MSFRRINFLKLRQFTPDPCLSCTVSSVSQAYAHRMGVRVGEDVPGLALLLVRGRVHVLIRRVQHIGVERVEVVVPLLAVQAFAPELVMVDWPLRRILEIRRACPRHPPAGLSIFNCQGRSTSDSFASPAFGVANQKRNTCSVPNTFFPNPIIKK